MPTDSVIKAVRRMLLTKNARQTDLVAAGLSPTTARRILGKDVGPVTSHSLSIALMHYGLTIEAIPDL